jgi:hypothetical protein
VIVWKLFVDAESQIRFGFASAGTSFTRLVACVRDLKILSRHGAFASGFYAIEFR